MRTGKTLYFDCAMGAAGDMLLGALFALAPAQDAFLQAFAALELPGVALTVQPVTQGETRGVQMELTVGGVTESGGQQPGPAPPHPHRQNHQHHHQRPRQFSCDQRHCPSRLVRLSSRRPWGKESFQQCRKSRFVCRVWPIGTIR